MATYHHHQPSTSPIKEHEHEGQELDDDRYEPSGSWCGSCLGSKWWGLPESGSDSDHHNHQSWWGHVKEKMKKAREVSEVAAGPKWKNFVRKVGGYFTGKKPRSRMRGNFQYDAESYALNFDGGGIHGQQDEEEQGLLLSSRFVASSFAKEHNHGGL